MPTIYTIGYTRKTAREFFGLLRSAAARRLLDIRLRKDSHIAGFARSVHLRFFVEELTDLAYEVVPLLAPSEELFVALRRDRDWAAYERGYAGLMERRRVAQALDRSLLEGGAVLLCGEPTPERCHRRLAAEFIKATIFPDARVVHLL